MDQFRISSIRNHGWSQQVGEEDTKIERVSPRDLMDPITRVQSE